MLRVEIEREEDGRWIGEIPELPGVVAYGTTEAEARTKVQALALRVIADRLEHGEPIPSVPSISLSRPEGMALEQGGRVHRALLRIGWRVKRRSGSSHSVRLPDYVWGFHHDVEIGPRMLARIAKQTGLRPEEL